MRSRNYNFRITSIDRIQFDTVIVCNFESIWREGLCGLTPLDPKIIQAQASASGVQFAQS